MIYDTNLLSYDGRLGRLSCFVTVLLTTLGGFTAGAVAGASGSQIIGIFCFFVCLGLFYIKICAFIKRCHDRLMNPWMLLLLMVPVANLALMIYLFVAPGRHLK